MMVTCMKRGDHDGRLQERWWLNQWSNQCDCLHTGSTLVVVYCRFKFNVCACFTLIIMFPLFQLEPPTIVSQNSSVYMVQGLSVQLNCTFDGIPVPTITWTSPNGSVATSQPCFLVQSTTTSTSLTISSPVVGVDNGTYTCSAYNVRGMSSTNNNQDPSKYSYNKPS